MKYANRTNVGPPARFMRTPLRRGAVAMLAMLYLVLFSTMAIGFYAAVTTASQTSNSDQRVRKSVGLMPF